MSFKHCLNVALAGLLSLSMTCSLVPVQAIYAATEPGVESATESTPVESTPTSPESPAATTDTSTENPTTVPITPENPDTSTDPTTPDMPGTPAEDETRDPVTFDADNFISKFTMSITSNDVNKVYDLKNAQHIDTEADFPGGLSRAATYVGNMTIDVKAMAEAQGKYPLVSGDKIQTPFPQMLRDNSTLKGRLRDATADWDGAHEGVGNYEIKDGKLTFTYDDGYLAEKSGKIIYSSVKFSGSFDFSSKTEGSFTTDLIFGSISMTTHWNALEIVRNLSIEKTGDRYGDSNHNSGPYYYNGTRYPLSGSAYVDNGFIFYTLKVSAGEDNTHILKNVKVTDIFTDESDKKVDLSTMTLLSASIDGEDILSRCTPLTDDAGNINGWNIGSLPPAQVATVRFKIKLNPDGITAAVDADKNENPAVNAITGRTIKNTATASADDVSPVTENYSTYVSNRVNISKSTYVDGSNGTSSYDYKTQTQNYKIVLTFSSENRYIEHNVPISDDVDRYGYYSTSDFDSVGIKSIIVEHSDGTTDDVVWENFENPTGKTWITTLPEAKPGDVFTIYSYAKYSDSYFSRQGPGIAGRTSTLYNYAYVGGSIHTQGGIYASDLNYTYDDTSSTINKKVLVKNDPSISNGYATWVITGNQRGKTATPQNVGGQNIKDTLGDNQEFEDGEAKVVFYSAEDGSKVGEDVIALHAGDTSFSYTIPEKYGTCEFRITYKSKITDWETYVGPTKRYYNTVEGLNSWRYTSYTSYRPRVASMSKQFVTQEGNWAQWRTAVYSDVQKGDVYTDTAREGIGYMYFTQEQLDAIELQFNGAAVDKSLYTIAPVGEGVDGKYQSWAITFNGQITSQQDGKTITPSSRTPITFTYKSTMVNPNRGNSRYYNNDARLKSGTFEDTDYASCYRNNSGDLSKLVQRSSNGSILWRIYTNYYDAIAQNDGTCIVTDTLPAGLEFVRAYKDSGTGDVQFVSQKKNEDGTTEVKLKLTGLHINQTSYSQLPLYFYVNTKIVDPEYLYGTESKDFNYVNKVTLTDRFGEPHSATASINVHHTAMKKSMEYTEETAPYAKFSIELNKEKIDLNPDGEMIDVADVSSDTLAVDPNSFEVINATTGDPVDFKINASAMDKNKITISVPDNMYVKVTYMAQVKGIVGKTVTVGNSAFFEGYESHHDENTINTPLVVLKAAGQAVSEPMVWLNKRNESAHALGGATFELNMYVPGEGWKVIRDDIKSSGDDDSNGTKVESLETGKLYRLVETDSPDGYVLDGKSYYFALFDENTGDISMPEDVDESEVLEGPAGSQITVYNAPYTKVKLHKASYDNVPLAGVQFEVYDTATEELAVDDKGQEARFTTDNEGNGYLTLAPGTYKLHEVAAPKNYETAKDVVFTVVGDENRTITQANKPVGEVDMIDQSKKTSLKVSKAWKDASNRDGVRPDSVQMQLMLNGDPVEGALIGLTKEGPDGVAGTEDDWTGTFDGLNVMVGGKEAVYTAREVDVAANYTDMYVDEKGEGSAASGTSVTNTRTFAPVSVAVKKVWDDTDDTNGLRPQTLSVHLLANGTDTGRTAQLTAAGPDLMLGTVDDWSASFDNLNAVANDVEIAYSVVEDVPGTYRLSGVPVADPDQYHVTITNQLKPMVWLRKLNEGGTELAGATFKLSAYSEGGWTSVKDNIATSAQVTGRGVRVDSLQNDVLYKLEETSAPNMYVLDSTPEYFVFASSDTATLEVPEGLTPEAIKHLATGATITRTNAPYTEVTVAKKSYDNVALSGVTLTILNSDGTQATDKNGAVATVTTGSDGRAKVVLAPGDYKLHEVAAPAGYEIAEDVAFTVTGNSTRDVISAGEVVAAVTMADASKKTSLPVAKIWKDANDRDGARPQSVKMQLTVDGKPKANALLVLTAEGSDGVAGTADDWTGSFDNLDVMRSGKQVVYGATEVDVPANYTDTYDTLAATEDTPAGVAVTNTRTFAPVSVAVQKVWDDAQDANGLRPASITVHLLANGQDTGRVAILSAAGPDLMLGTADDWSASFDNLDAVANDAEITYTVAEDAVAGYTQLGEPTNVAAGYGYNITNQLKPIVWLQKQDESGTALPGATFELASYKAEGGWTTIASDLTTTNAARGIRLASLESDKLYRLTEVSAPNMYVLDSTPYYFVLNQTAGTAAPAPADLAPEAIHQLATGATITRTNAPYTEVTLAKQSYDGVALAGVQLTVLNSDGTQATDKNGAVARVSTDADGTAKVVLAPGDYKLHEVAAPEGYELAEDVAFTVTGNSTRDVTSAGEVVAAVTMVDASQKTSLPVAKTWLDANDRDGVRPDSVTLQLTVDGAPEPEALLVLTAEGPDGELNTTDDWTGSFDNLDIMRAGKKVTYDVVELDVPEGYTATYAPLTAPENATDGAPDNTTSSVSAGVAITNRRTFAPVSVAVHKTWDDANNVDRVRPSALTVHLLANGADTGKTATLTQLGPDGQAGTVDDWSATFDRLDAVIDDAEVTYTVTEEVPDGYTQTGEAIEVDPTTFGLTADKGFELVNHHTPKPQPAKQEQPKATKQEHSKPIPTKHVTPKTGDTVNPMGGAIVALIGAGLVAVSAYRRKKDKRD